MSDEDLTIISETEILYKGTRFVADPNNPNKISIYLIKDNHTTLSVHGQTVEEIVRYAKELVEEHPDANTGILFLMHGRKEITRRYFYVNKDAKVLCDRDRSLEDLLKLEDTMSLLATNPHLN